MELTSKHFGSSPHTIEGIIREKDVNGNPTERVVAHYMVYYQFDDVVFNDHQGIKIYDILIAELQASRDALIEYYKKPTAQYYRGRGLSE